MSIGYRTVVIEASKWWFQREKMLATLNRLVNNFNLDGFKVDVRAGGLRNHWRIEASGKPVEVLSFAASVRSLLRLPVSG